MVFYHKTFKKGFLFTFPIFCEKIKRNHKEENENINSSRNFGDVGISKI